MKLKLGLVLGVLASLLLAEGSALAAESFRWPRLGRPYDPWRNVELGVRYWYSEGKDEIKIDSSEPVPFYGNPTSVLDYDDVDANSAEFLWRIENPSGWYFKGFVGAGVVDDGTFDDEDFFAGQVKFSDTLSKIDGDSLVYFTLDIGRTFTRTTRRGRFSLAPQIGVSFWRQEVKARGAICNPDHVGGIYCGAPGEVAIPLSTKVITNDQDWTSLRLGLEARATLFDRLTLVADVGWLPISYLDTDDSHHLRNDLGEPPNIRYKGTGHGVQVEVAGRYRFTPRLAVGGGFRYWYSETDGDTDFTNYANEVRLRDYESERYGAFAELLYQFSWY